ncbi:hypothetical protein [Catenulispora rubra]|uniref:hypothetical protein n=1 Tax=Catenulispora rubra TaxID=280293 RepID=UPI00189276A3|nr:hypothetical protein [Catenulispora rubra]
MPEAEPTALRVLVVERRWRTYETFRRHFEEAARTLAAETNDPRLAALSVSRTQFERWLRGGLTTRPYPNASAVLQRMFSVEVDVLLGPASEANLQEQAQAFNLKSEITMAAHESSEHAAYAAARAIDNMTIEQLQEDVTKVAREYPEKAPIESFAEAKRIRDLALSLLDRTGRPAQESDLYVAAGQACGILATVSFDLGYTDAASEQARTVFIYGRMVGHEGLCAWAMGMRALIANWSEFPLAALELVAKGLATAPAGTPTARLHAIGARAYSQLGNAISATESAGLALSAADSDAPADELHDDIGGEFSFDGARLRRCLGSAYVNLKLAEPAARHARQVIELYDTGAPIVRMPKVAIEARIELAHALILSGDLDGAADTLGTVFDLPQPQRVHGVTERLVKARQALALPSYQGSSEALDLGARIEVFAAESAGAIAPALPPRRS